jgi:hypothetical protein
MQTDIQTNVAPWRQLLQLGNLQEEKEILAS